MNKLVSIVLPTYNGESFLAEAIESCLNQTYKNLELIIVNDCSTDNTEEIIKSYSDSRIVYIKNKINQKLPKSLNVGFEKAKGELFTWTSDDNTFEPEAIEVMVSELLDNDVDLVYANYQLIDDKSEITGKRTVGQPKDIFLDNIVKACFLYRKEVQLQLKGYNPDLFLVEDYDFWIRVVLNDFKLHPVDRYLYRYRFHQGSLTEQRRQEINSQLVKLLLQRISELNENKKNLLLNAKVYLRLAKSQRVLNDMTGFRTSIATIFKKYPSGVLTLAYWKNVAVYIMKKVKSGQ